MPQYILKTFQRQKKHIVEVEASVYAADDQAATAVADQIIAQVHAVRSAHLTLNGKTIVYTQLPE